MVEKKKIKPFADPGFTMVNNHIFDYIMPKLRPNAWKVLCVAIRQTLGWEDKTTENGRKEEDEISYSQFLRKTGIGSKTTLSEAIKECLGEKYLKRREMGKHPGTNKPIYAYRLNKKYEMEVPGTESVLADSSTENGLEPGTESVPGEGQNPSTESVQTKERVPEKKEKKTSSASSAKKKPTSKQKPTALLPDTKQARMMFGRLQANASAQGRRGPKKFPTLECKQGFDEAVAKLGDQEFEKALLKALKQGINSVTRITAYISAWADNGGQQRQKGASNGSHQGVHSDRKRRPDQWRDPVPT